MQTMTETLQKLIGKPLVESTDQEIYLALLDLVRSKSAAQVRPVNGRKLYYISAEFLIGKLLSNNLINLACMMMCAMPLLPQARAFPTSRKSSREPSLGNGGLGRLAACFLDSLATLNLPGDGIGLRYHFGLFHQSFADGLQNELPGPLAERTFLGGKDRYHLPRHPGRQTLHCPAVQTGRDRLRGPHQHPEPV